MRALIIGYGSIGRRHADVFHELGCEIAFLRSGFAQPNRPKSKAPAVEFFSADDALDWDPNFAVVATPTSQHFSGAEWAISHGLPSLVEKPLTGAVHLSSRLYSLARTNRVTVKVGYQLRTLELGLKFGQLRQRLDLGAEPVSFSCEWATDARSWHPWEHPASSYAFQEELGGGVINTLSHEVDLLTEFFGLIEEVQAVSPPSYDFGVMTAVKLRLKMESGISGVLALDMTAQSPQRFLTLHYPQGSLRFDVMDFCFSVGGKLLDQPPIATGHSQLYFLQARAFIESLRSRYVSETIQDRKTEANLHSLRRQTSA